MSMSSFKEIEYDFNAVNYINEILNANQIHILINLDLFAILISHIDLINILEHKNERHNYQRITNYYCNEEVPRLTKVSISVNKIPFFDYLSFLIVIVSVHLLFNCFIYYIIQKDLFHVSLLPCFQSNFFHVFSSFIPKFIDSFLF